MATGGANGSVTIHDVQMAFAQLVEQAGRTAMAFVDELAKPIREVMQVATYRFALAAVQAAPSRDGLWHVGAFARTRRAWCGRYRAGKVVMDVGARDALEPIDRCRACDEYLHWLKAQANANAT